MGLHGQKDGEAVISSSDTVPKRRGRPPKSVSAPSPSVPETSAPAVITVWVGGHEIRGAPVKIQIVRILSRLAEACGADVYFGRDTVTLSFREKGDVAWMKQNVFRFVDITESRGESSAKRITDTLIGMVGEERSRMGWAVMMYKLDEMLMRYDVIQDCVILNVGEKEKQKD